MRLENALALFDEFVAQTVRTTDAATLRGLERRFAEQLLIQPSYWSQIKSRTRQIGDRLARQFESRCRKPPGWMDERHAQRAETPLALQLPFEPPPVDTSSTPRDDDERFIMGLVLSYYRRHPQRARARLLELLSEVLAPPPRASSAPAAQHPSPDDAQTLWAQTQRGVAPLKRKR
ncbi:MAG: hypothetical protein JNJ71_19710 [Rubrivivax sp.]|nr:hypothetical protein [Rubrivivax sp.]